jgi:biotin transport system substrate-specific component
VDTVIVRVLEPGSRNGRTGERHYPDRMSAHRSTSRDLALIAVFAAFIAALGLPGGLYLPGSSVPVTLQTFGVMVAGCVLGARRAALAVATVLLLALAGMPVLATGFTGLTAFSAPTGGFILGWVAGAWVIGRLVQLWPRGLWFGWGFLANIVGGIVVVYAVGTPVMASRSGLTLAQGVTAMWVFVPGDLMKAALAAVIAAGVHRGYPSMLPVRERAEKSVR